MAPSTARLAVLVCVALGCGARTDLELGEDEELLECTADLTPRVEDCSRAAADAAPLAKLFGWRVVADDEFLYYPSEGQIFRLAKTEGEPEALTPPKSAYGAIHLGADGLVYWVHYGAVMRVPAAGGEPEMVVDPEIAEPGVWTIAGELIVWTDFLDAGPLFRTSLTTGETKEILAPDPSESVYALTIDGQRVLVARNNSLIAVPLDGGKPQVLPTRGGVEIPPLVRGRHVYFGAHFATMGIYRVDLETPSKPELVVPGFPNAFVFDDDALYASIIPQSEGSEEVQGRIVRVPLSGGEPAFISYTDASYQGSYTGGWHPLIVSGCNLYFIDRCDADPSRREARLVTASKVP